MQVFGHVHGGGPIIKKFFGDANIAQGLPAISSGVATTNDGSVISIANAAGNPVVGLTNDAITGYPSNPEAQLNTDASLQVTLNVRPDAIYRAKVSGSSTADTAIGIGTTTGASALGITLTGVTTLDDGAVWGYAGANSGVVRRANDTSGSVSAAFPNATAIGDTFLAAQGFMGVASTSQAYFDLTTDFSQIDAATADSDNDNFVIFDWELNDFAASGTTNSYYHLLPWKHIYSGSANQS